MYTGASSLDWLWSFFSNYVRVLPIPYPKKCIEQKRAAVGSGATIRSQLLSGIRSLSDLLFGVKIAHLGLSSGMDVFVFDTAPDDSQKKGMRLSIRDKIGFSGEFFQVSKLSENPLVFKNIRRGCSEGRLVDPFETGMVSISDLPYGAKPFSVDYSKPTRKLIIL